MDPRLRATGAGQESSSSLIPQERKLRDILLSVPPKRGKGHHHFFYVPHSGHVEHCRGFCFPSLSRAPLIDVSIRVSSKLPPISPSTNYLMVNVRCYGTKFGTFFLVDFSYISLKSKKRASVFGLIRAIYLKKCLTQIFEIVLKLNHSCAIR